MTKQVLILNITRMGDLVQTVPLIQRLQDEWPGVAIDLVVDQHLASVAALMPGLRQVLSYDFREFLDQTRPDVRGGSVQLQDLAAWAQPLKAVGYDRVINLTFTKRSGLLAAALGVPDTRGAVTDPAGTTVVRNPWLTYCVDMHRFRRFNRFNVADLFALGGSGPGSCAPLRLTIPKEADQWAGRFLATNAKENSMPTIAVQMGASKAKKTWRPEYFGRTMAVISRRLRCAFVLVGAKSDAADVAHGMAAYHAAGWTNEVCDAVGRTHVSQLAALLSHCRLLLTNDTGPRHLAVGVGTQVINLSVGHVDFRETGPYGPGHWVVQPVLDCAPCDVTQVCEHHRCKDQIVPEQVAALASHVLGGASWPTGWTGVRVYESGVDADGLATYQQRAGDHDVVSDWYGSFWWKYWYETLTNTTSQIVSAGSPPDVPDQQQCFDQLAPAVDRVVRVAERLVEVHRQNPATVSDLKTVQTELVSERWRAMQSATASPAFGPITTALLRDLYNGRVLDVAERLDRQAHAYRTWRRRIHEVMNRLRIERGTREGGGPVQLDPTGCPLIRFGEGPAVGGMKKHG
jgi:ADP-heptose:LPS heptosyltransferase